MESRELLVYYPNRDTTCEISVWQHGDLIYIHLNKHIYDSFKIPTQKIIEHPTLGRFYR